MTDISLAEGVSMDTLANSDSDSDSDIIVFESPPSTKAILQMDTNPPIKLQKGDQIIDLNAYDPNGITSTKPNDQDYFGISLFNVELDLEEKPDMPTFIPRTIPKDVYAPGAWFSGFYDALLFNLCMAGPPENADDEH
jgi:hypothetical protein